MAKTHGKKTVVIIDAVDLSQYSNNSTVEITADSHDTTTYGKDWHVFDAGLLTSNFTVSGFYDSTASTGPRAKLEALIIAATKVNFKHRPEGTGSGLPQDSVDVLVTKYTQTHPVADYVTWSVELQGSDAVTTTAQ